MFLHPSLSVIQLIPETYKPHVIYFFKNLGQFGPKAKIDSNSITVSGLSSGAFMSTQLHVALSSLIKGSGIFAGGEIHCCQLNLVSFSSFDLKAFSRIFGKVLTEGLAMLQVELSEVVLTG